MKNKTAKILVIILVICLIIFGVTRCVKSTLNSLNETLDDTSAPMLYTVAKQDMNEYINSKGTISSDSIVSITSNLIGQKINDLYVEVGDTVTQGQKIATVDVSDINSEINDLKSLKSKTNATLKKLYEEAVSSKDVLVAEAQADYDDAKDAYDEYVTLCESDASLCNDVEEGKLLSAKKTLEKTLNKTIKDCDAAISEAKANMEETSEYDSKIKELQSKVNGAIIYAPSAGLITSLKINKGGLIATNEIGVIQNSDDYKVTVNISESAILKIKTGMKATIKVVATGDKKYSGTVTKVNKLPNNDSYDDSSVGYKAVISIDDKNTDLLIGMTAKCKIYLYSDEKKLAVPYDAVHKDEKGSYVYSINKNGSNNGYYMIEYKYISVGLEGTYYTEVTEGLNEGDLIYVTSDELLNGEAVEKQVIDNTAFYLGGK